MSLNNNHQGNKEVYLTYFNVRHSISVLLVKIIFIDFLAGFFHILLYELLIRGAHIINYEFINNPLSYFIFAVIVLTQVFITTYVVLQWLNEYYEITADEIVHKNGIIFKHVEKYRFDNVRAVSTSESFLGELLNFGTITLYDIRMQKYLDMFLIHNPKRYFKIIKALKPNIEYKVEETILPGITHEEETFKHD